MWRSVVDVEKAHKPNAPVEKQDWIRAIGMRFLALILVHHSRAGGTKALKRVKQPKLGPKGKRSASSIVFLVPISEFLNDLNQLPGIGQATFMIYAIAK